MSLKENVDYIKQEISNEEKFFESFFKLEKFWKKYKIIIIAVVVAVLGYFITNAITSYISEQNAIAANKAYKKLILNPNDKASIAILKEKNMTLLSLAQYTNSKDNTTQNDVIYLKQIALYNKAVKQNDLNKINALIINPDFLLRNYAIFSKALILTSNKEYFKAKQTLDLIPNDSNVKNLSDVLKHYLLTK